MYISKCPLCESFVNTSGKNAYATSWLLPRCSRTSTFYQGLKTTCIQQNFFNQYYCRNTRANNGVWSCRSLTLNKIIDLFFSSLLWQRVILHEGNIITIKLPSLNLAVFQSCYIYVCIKFHPPRYTIPGYETNKNRIFWSIQIEAL